MKTIATDLSWDEVLDYLLNDPGSSGDDPDWVANVRDQIEQYPSWKLVEVPLNALDIIRLPSVMERARRSMRLRTPVPPIIAVPSRGVSGGKRFAVVDGNARALCASLKHRRSIQAFVPDEI